MKPGSPHFVSKLFLTIALLLFPVFAYSQNDLPNLKPLQQGNNAGWYSRMDGEFIVEIPVDIAVNHYILDDYREHLGFIKCPYRVWKTMPIAEGLDMNITFCNLETPPKTDADKQAFLEARKAEEIKLSGKKIKIGELPALNEPGGNARSNGFSIVKERRTILIRQFIFKDRFYVICASYVLPELESTALRFMNSFRFVDREKIAEMRIEAADPGELPQIPVIKKTTTDVFDERLKGRVKTVFDEAAVYENGKPGIRQMRGEMEFDRAGNILRKIVYADGAPIQIERYGFIEGKRVFKTASIPHDNWNPPPSQNVPAAAAPPRDPRYHGYRVYKYDPQGRVAEKNYYSSDGRRESRFAYVYRQNIFTETFFSPDGQRQQAGIMTFSRKGFITKLRTKPYTGKVPPVTWVFEYKSYDAKGNWTRRTISRPKTVGTEKFLEPVSEEYRRVEYY